MCLRQVELAIEEKMRLSRLCGRCIICFATNNFLISHGACLSISIFSAMYFFANVALTPRNRSYDSPFYYISVPFIRERFDCFMQKCFMFHVSPF